MRAETASAAPNLSRLLQPRSVAVIGGGGWCRQVVRQLRRAGFDGEVWRVHPSPDTVEGVAACRRIEDLPAAPDAAFIGVNRVETIGVVSALSARGAGGAVCFASGFSEAQAEDAGGRELQARLVAAAGAMPILGPNCYGFINALDGALLWPDQHGCKPVARGVAILTQSSNIAINLTMQARGLPVAFVATCGNMAQVSQAALAMALLDDARVSAIGLHVEGFADTGAWYRLARRARDRGVALVVLKTGLSEVVQSSALSHTASLAGSAAGAAALLAHLGVPQVHDLSTFLETLKLLHVTGGLPNRAISAICCSGGEASLVANLAVATGLDLPPLDAAQRQTLQAALGPMVALGNPLDYHTYIWGDLARMTEAWQPMISPRVAITLIVLDYPRTDAGDWAAATQAALAVAAQSCRPVAVVATLPELMPEELAEMFVASGVVPLCGLREALAAVAAAASLADPQPIPPAVPTSATGRVVLDEAMAKQLLSCCGVQVPSGQVAARGGLCEAAQQSSDLLAVKSLGVAHKSEASALRLGVHAESLEAAAADMPGTRFLVEELVAGGTAELLVGVIRDPAHGYVLTLGAGGVLTELWQDTKTLLLPVDAGQIETALLQLRIAPLLGGYRGRPAAAIQPIIDAVLAVQACAVQHDPPILEIEINPLICTPHRAVAVDALIVTADAKEPLPHAPYPD